MQASGGVPSDGGVDGRGPSRTDRPLDSRLRGNDGRDFRLRRHDLASRFAPDMAVAMPQPEPICIRREEALSPDYLSE